MTDNERLDMLLKNAKSVPDAWSAVKIDATLKLLEELTIQVKMLNTQNERSVTVA